VKVVYVIDGLGFGGTERQLLHLVDGIARRRDVVVASLSDKSIHLLPRFEMLSVVRTVLCPKLREAWIPLGFPPVPGLPV
jgi:hypothetical protein